MANGIGSIIRLILYMLLVSTLTACPASAKKQKVRVRKELRSLTEEEYKLFIEGLSTMMTIPTAAGQQLFGSMYKNYDYFIVKHVIASTDPRGDQGHYGPCFMTFHRAMLLEFEQALLSVVPHLKAMPYWDLTLDFNTGKYRNTPNSMFGPLYAGSYNTSASKNYSVTDGVLGMHEVHHFDWAEYQQVSSLYNGSLTTGLLRSATNNNTNKYLTRYPVAGVRPLMEANIKFVPNVWTDAVLQGLDCPLSELDFLRCVDPSNYTNWMEWNFCVDMGSFLDTHANSSFFDSYRNSLSPIFHPSLHLIVGGMSANGMLGDVADVATSPNEAMLFFPHHANIDRNNMIWQRNAQKLNRTMAQPDVMWGFPNSTAQYPYVKPGCYLHDVISSTFPFTDVFGAAANSTGITHFELLDNTRPGQASYTYDNMYCD